MRLLCKGKLIEGKVFAHVLQFMALNSYIFIRLGGEAVMLLALETPRLKIYAVVWPPELETTLKDTCACAGGNMLSKPESEGRF